MLVGGTGTGKSHLAIAIARACIRGGARGRFFNTVDLAITAQLKVIREKTGTLGGCDHCRLGKREVRRSPLGQAQAGGSSTALPRGSGPDSGGSQCWRPGASMPAHPECAAMFNGEWEDFKQRIGKRPAKERSRTFPAIATHRFVWLAGPKGPTPQLWHHRNVGVDSANGKQTVAVLRSHDLTPDQAELPLDELAKLFPAPETAPTA